jgi:hypothetical protein
MSRIPSFVPIFEAFAQVAELATSQQQGTNRRKNATILLKPTGAIPSKVYQTVANSCELLLN